MRVISGKARGHRLKAVPGDSTRPITDRVKENLFNILGDWVIGTSWLDLFAGTGQVGIEALSRGASEVVFIDNERKAVQTIHENLEHTKLTAGSTVLMLDAFKYLNSRRHQPFDVIYVAPPQYKEIWIRIIEWIDLHLSEILTHDGLVTVQIDPREFTELKLSHLRLDDQRKYGRTLLCFYGPAGSNSS